jgi:hypothetical protein
MARTSKPNWLEQIKTLVSEDFLMEAHRQWDQPDKQISLEQAFENIETSMKNVASEIRWKGIESSNMRGLLVMLGGTIFRYLVDKEVRGMGYEAER